MKFRQQIQTSAKQLLGKSGQGFGTVAAHPDIPRVVREYTDNLGITVIEGEANASYCFARVEGWILLNRTIVAPADQTGRSNHVAHTLAAPESEVKEWLDAQQASGEALWSPAALMLQFEVAGTWREAWNEDPRELGEADLIASPTMTEGSSWLPTVWQEHPEKALAALTADTQLKPLKWNWEEINDAVEQLRCYAQTFAVMDPDQGENRPQPEIERLFPANLRCSWEWTFATVLLDAQRPDDFKWFGASKGRSKGSASQREEFVPSQAKTSPDDDRVGYVKDKEEAIKKINREAYNEAAIKLKGLLEEWKSCFERRFPYEIPNALNFLSEVDEIIQSCRNTKNYTSAEQQKVTEIEKSLLEAKVELLRFKNIGEQWKDIAEEALTHCRQFKKPTSLDEALYEFKQASESLNSPSEIELESEYQSLQSDSERLQLKIQDLNNETQSLKQYLDEPQPVNIGTPHVVDTHPPPATRRVTPSQRPVVSQPSSDLLPSDQRTTTQPLQFGTPTTIKRSQHLKPETTKRQTNAIAMWILSATTVVLIGVICWTWGKHIGHGQGIERGKAERESLKANRYTEGLDAGLKEGHAKGLAEGSFQTSNTQPPVTAPSENNAQTGSNASPKKPGTADKTSERPSPQKGSETGETETKAKAPVQPGELGTRPESENVEGADKANDTPRDSPSGKSLHKSEAAKNQ